MPRTSISSSARAMGRPAGQAFATSLASPSQGRCPFMVIAQPNIPIKPMTLYANKAAIDGELQGNATWGGVSGGHRQGGHRCVARRYPPGRSRGSMGHCHSQLGQPGVLRPRCGLPEQLQRLPHGDRAAPTGKLERAQLAGVVGQISNPSTALKPEAAAMQYLRLGNSGL